MRVAGRIPTLWVGVWRSAATTAASFGSPRGHCVGFGFQLVGEGLQLRRLAVPVSKRLHE